MKTTDAQVRRLMKEMNKHGQIGVAAVRAGMDRKTARKYVKAGKFPSELKQPRRWRTRSNPFDADWAEVVGWLRESPGLEAKTLFQLLREARPGKYQPGQVRTLQRHVRNWRAQNGPEQDVKLAQVHRPGEAAQTDFTEATSLLVTIAGAQFEHLLCVFVLPYSNWSWATVCLSESLAALRKGVQAALFQLGRSPHYHQTDNSTAATHRIPQGKEGNVKGRKRLFNQDYLALMRHFEMEPRTTKIGAKEQNGDVEAGNGALKRRLEQALLIRGNRDFESTQAWENFVHDVLRKANSDRGLRVAEDMAAMRPLRAGRLPEFIDEDVRVCEWSTLRVHHCAYSVPSRLIGETVRVRLFEERVEVYFQGVLQLACERVRSGGHRHRIDYRHVVWSLVRKPGAFARYVYREELFPSVVFRRAYDAIQTPHSGLKGDLEYLRILHLAASTIESDVEAALSLMLSDGRPVTADAVKALVSTQAAVAVPDLLPAAVNLVEYDSLLGEVGT